MALVVDIEEDFLEEETFQLKFKRREENELCERGKENFRQKEQQMLSP